MITSVFKKSTPFNFSLVVILILVFFFLYQFQDSSWTNSNFMILHKVGLLVVILTSVFLTNFISKKNTLSKDSCYTIFFYSFFLLFFPTVLDNSKLILANFFILLALRRLISLHSLKASKEKIFDASFWIFIASLFHFWAIIYLVLVFISIIFHVARDYRYWALPFIAFFSVGTIFIIFSIIFNVEIIPYFDECIKTDLALNYFTNNYQNLAFSIFVTIALFFLISMVSTVTNRALIVQPSLKKIIVSFVIGIIIFIISAHKSNDLLLFTIPTLSIMATAHIEIPQLKLKQEMVLVVFILCSLFAFFSQL